MKLNIAYSIVALSMMSPTVARLGCPPSWKTGETYASGDLVSVDGIVFQCTNTAYYPFCSQDGFKPVPSSPSSFGAPYTLAWETLGPCNGVAITTPVPTPPQLGCPRKWIAGADYVAGSLVSMNGQILRGASLRLQCLPSISYATR